MDENLIYGIDPGAGAVKIFSAAGGTQVPSQVAINGSSIVGPVEGLAMREPPLHVRTDAGSFWVGLGAHDWGRPVENLDYGRFAGGPEMEAMLFGAMGQHFNTYGRPRSAAAIQIKVGLPQQALMGDAIREIVPSVKSWLLGEHSWHTQNGTIPPRVRQLAFEHLERFAESVTKDELVDRATHAGAEAFKSWTKTTIIEAMLDVPDLVRDFSGMDLWHDYQCAVGDVQVTSQPVGAWFDFLLDMKGGVIPARKALFQQEVGVISVGMATVELLAVQGGKASPRFTRGETEGVQRLLELLNPHRYYSRGEMDARLRTGALAGEIEPKLPVWWADVNGLIENVWGNAWERFGAVVVVGGGTLLLRDYLLRKFREKLIVPDDPVMAVARGLWKFGVFQAHK